MENKTPNALMLTYGLPIVSDPNKNLVLKVDNEPKKEIKLTLKNIWAHFKKICIHKFWVARYCFKAGLFWQGIFHDMSKFSWIEFFESAKYYQGESSPINAAKEDLGYSIAWQHHKGRNPHHYEYWTDKYDEGTTCIEMPYKYLVEMVCDYIGAGKAYWGNKFTFKGEYDWWLKKQPKAKMHNATALYVTIIFEYLAKLEKDGKNPELAINSYNFKYIYDNYKRIATEIIEETISQDIIDRNYRDMIRHLSEGIFKKQ